VQCLKENHSQLAVSDSLRNVISSPQLHGDVDLSLFSPVTCQHRVKKIGARDNLNILSVAQFLVAGLPPPPGPQTAVVPPAGISSGQGA